MGYYATTALKYENRCNVTSVTDAQGHTVSNIYNAAGLETAVIDPLGRQTTTAWTPTYKVASVTYPDSSVVSNRYDSRDWLVAVVDARGGVYSNQLRPRPAQDSRNRFPRQPHRPKQQRRASAIRL